MFEGTKKDNQEPWIEEEQTIKWLKGKGLRDKQLSTKHYADSWKSVNTITSDKFWTCTSYCASSGTGRGTLATNTVISHEWGNARTVITINNPLLHR
jgi:hypothetical protein